MTPTKPTKEQWQKLAEKLDCLFIPVYLRCDGYLISAALQRVEHNKLAVVPWINDRITSDWAQVVESADELPEEGRRFWRHRKHRQMPTKLLKDMEQAFGKRECRKRGYYDPFHYCTPDFPSANAFIRHIKRHNDSIEILDHATYLAALEKIKEEPDQ